MQYPILYLRLIKLSMLIILCLSQFAVAQINTKQINTKQVGSVRCVTCHKAEYQAWQGSHHQLAMEVASVNSVLGNFNQARIKYKQRQALFFKKESDFFVETDDPQGKLQTFKISHTFGVFPLQQYIVEFEKGRKQVLDIAWDARPKNVGGQTWFFLGSNHNQAFVQQQGHGEYFASADAADNADFHWMGPFYNWNNRCASCHVTGFQKNYNDGTQNYDTKFTELGVACEACHGGAQSHLAWTQGKLAKVDSTYSGFAMSIKDNGVWSKALEGINKANNKVTTKSRSGVSADTQVGVCAGCHSRRLQLKDRQAELDFNDNYMPMLIETPIYHSDGQVNDEDFVWGSFQQSKMQQAGVVCSNCHDAHSLKLKNVNNETDKGSKNGVCVQCHNAESYNDKQHHQHKKLSTGSQCINCHMPATTFMNVDKRFDHSFRVPNPQQSQKINSPDACTSCHQDKDQDWAQQQIQQWRGGKKSKVSQHDQFALPFFNGQNASGHSAEQVRHELLSIANDFKQGDLVRASAISHMASQGLSSNSLSTLQQLLASESALIRLAAVRALTSLPVSQKFQLLQPYLAEASLSVRMEMAKQLASLPLPSITPAQANKVKALFKDLIAAARYNADTADNQVVLADFYLARQEWKKAESHYLIALNIQPNFEPALLNLADLYRGLKQDQKALPHLLHVVSIYPESANGRYALGLLYVRTGDIKRASHELEQASKLQINNASYAYTYALILQHANKKAQAKTFVKQWLGLNGPHPMLQRLLNSL